MTLQDAIRTMGTTSSIQMQSDDELAHDIGQRQAEILADHPDLPGKYSVQPAIGIDGVLAVRPISAMLELARGTVFDVDRDIAAFGRRWPILRYLGVIANRIPEQVLHLDAAALEFIGPNQRRVLSEELGVGFGIVVAKHWCRSRAQAAGPIAVVDVDRALRNGGGPRLRREGDRQPDYLLSYPDPSGRTVYELLETKGTVSVSNAKSQLSRAATQLAGLTISGRSMTGIAVATVSSEQDIRALAIDPEEAPVMWTPEKGAIADVRSQPPKERPRAAKVDVSAEEFLATATNVGNASLALFGAQHQTAKRWLPNLEEGRAPTAESQVTRETDVGTFVGAELYVDLPGSGRLRLFHGVGAEVADTLQDLDPQALLEAQRKFVDMDSKGLEDAGAWSGLADVASATAISSDGSMLEISSA